MDRLEGASAAQLTIYWEGRPVPARADDSVAAALHAAGIRTIGRTRKLHRSLGSGGTFALGLQAEAEGIPNVRIDRLPVREGLRLRAQNVWPNARFDLLRLARFIPRRWLRGGFEHPSWLPSGRPGFEAWERMLRFLAGGGRAIRPSRPGAIVAGEKIQADVAIVGGGPAGRQAAIEAASRQQSVVMISRSLPPGRFAEAMGRRLPAIPDGARVLAGFEAFGLYRRGRILAAAPHDGSGAAVVEARKIVLTTGARSIPPLVPGADLPGVMDLPTAAGLLHFHRIAPGRAVVLIGSGDLSAVSDRLRGQGARTWARPQPAACCGSAAAARSKESC